jgi:hypothetical protein
MEAIRDQCIRIYQGYKALYQEEYQTAKLMIQHGIKVYPGHDATLEEVCFSFPF